MWQEQPVGYHLRILLITFTSVTYNHNYSKMFAGLFNAIPGELHQVVISPYTCIDNYKFHAYLKYE